MAKFKAVAENTKEVESIIEAILESFRKITDDVVGEVKLRAKQVTKEKVKMPNCTPTTTSKGKILSK